MTDTGERVTAALEVLLRDATARQPIAQMIAAVERGDGSYRWAGARGNDEAGQPLSPESPFFIASIDKLYNAAVALALSEDGRIDLDAPIANYLPSAIWQGLHRLRGRDRSAELTVRHLLSHTSGLADWLEDSPKSGPSLIAAVLEGGDRTLDMEEIAAHVRDRLTPHFAPQDPRAAKAKARYSDTNFMLVMAIIEAVMGRPLHEVHAQMLHEPLGLRHTYFPGLSEPLAPTPAPAVLRAAGEPLRIPLLMRSIRGIYSTTGDTMAFLRHLVRGGACARPDLLDTMTRQWHGFGLPLDRAALRAPGWPVKYGLGIMHFRLPRLFTAFAPVPAVLGHTGSTGCWLFYCPDHDLLLAGSVDEATAGALPYRLVPKILRALTSIDPAVGR